MSKDDKTAMEQIFEAIDSAEADPDRHLRNQMDRSLTEAVRAAQQSGKSATVTLKIQIKPNAERRVICSAGVDAKLPRPPVGAVSLFADGLGNLHDVDPQQMKMRFHEVLTPSKKEGN